MTEDIYRAVSGLVKSDMAEPLIRSKVMPRRPFVELFQSWEANDQLSMFDLRLKTLTLLSFAVLLRPSDVAPRAKRLDGTPFYFSRKFLDFSNKCVIMYFHGIKNDRDHDGFRLVLNPVPDTKVCPMAALRTYIQRTSHLVPADGPVFVTLSAPHQSLSATGVADVLRHALHLVGLDACGFTPKHFRPTGATAAVEQGVPPEQVQAMGRWKSTETFYKHYVHAQPVADFSSKILTS